MSLHTSMRVAYTHVRIRHANLFGLCSFVVQIYPLSVTQFLTRNDFYFFIFIFGENNEEEEGTQHGVSVCVSVGTHWCEAQRYQQAKLSIIRADANCTHEVISFGTELSSH